MKEFRVAQGTSPRRLAQQIAKQLQDANAVQLYAVGRAVPVALDAFSKITPEVLPTLRPIIISISYDSVAGCKGPLKLTKLTVVALPRT